MSGGRLRWWRRLTVAAADLVSPPAGQQVRLRPGSRRTVARLSRTVTSMRLLDGAFVRVHRVGAPGAGAERHNPDVPGDGRVTFVLLHGVGLSSVYLLPLAEDLAVHGEVLLVDLPGFGDVPPPARTLGIDGLAEVVDDVLVAAGVHDPVLVGHSMGAQVAVELMARRPEAYHRTVLVAPPVNAAERHPLTQLWRYLQSAVHETHRLRLLATRSYLTATTRWVADILPEVMGYRIEERLALASAEATVSILHGEHDRLVPPDWATDLAGRVTRCEVELVPGAAHSVVVEDHPAVVRAALAHLAVDERSGPGSAVPPGSASDDGRSLTDES
ncbi:alpha/beta fold hydrolase [Georgenia sp. Z1344]|uniref:alpha/beta fold hydrolase n=1 Tax=Georgenia sp. Z1344 TaxID=3416706 RepID=UPI003CF1F741